MSVSARPLRIGVDIGGTFTDVMLVDDRTGRSWLGKTLTTPADPSIAVHGAVTDLLADAGRSAAEVQNVIHGTTLVTNTIIERKGARTALLTTRGFRDAVEIARESRYDLYDLSLELPPPLVPRRWRREVNERVLADGAVFEPLDLEAAGRTVRELVAQRIEAIAVCLLHSFRNPSHEQALAELVRRIAPDVRVAISSEVSPEIREYERASTTIANVYVQPLVERYLRELERHLAAMGFEAQLFTMLSSGGIATVDTAARFPVRLVESGPAAGALAAAQYGRLAGYPNLLSFDMGGTTVKACLIDDGEPLTTPEMEVARVYRFKKGSGLPVKVRVIEMIEVGAGGGSIAHVDRLGLLRVGPESAGASPGPACYGLGGIEPTVTDADLVLGYLDPSFFLGGRMRLDREAAARAIDKIAGQLGMTVDDAAWGIHQIVNENMASAARIHAVERGRDVRAYPLFAFGGAGPVHAYRVAQILGESTLICPLGAGVASALGLLVAPLAFDFVRSAYGFLDELPWDRINTVLDDMRSEGHALLRHAGVPAADVAMRRSADMRYTGQGHEINVPVPTGRLGPESRDTIMRSFEAAYQQLYHRLGPAVAVEVLNWRVVVSGPRPTLTFPEASGSGDARAAIKGERQAYFPESGGFRPTRVYDRYGLGPGAEFAGPAIVEEHESTVIIGPGGHCRIDSASLLVAEMPR